MKRLFKTGKVPPAADLAARIEELEARLAAVPGEIEEAHAGLGAGLALGEDTAGAKNKIIGLTAELGALPSAIEALRAELLAVRQDEARTAIQAERADATKKLEAVLALWAPVVQAYADFQKKAGALGLSDLPGSRVKPADVLTLPGIADRAAAAQAELMSFFDERARSEIRSLELQEVYRKRRAG